MFPNERPFSVLTTVSHVKYRVSLTRDYNTIGMKKPCEAADHTL